MCQLVMTYLLVRNKNGVLLQPNQWKSSRTDVHEAVAIIESQPGMQSLVQVLPLAPPTTETAVVAPPSRKHSPGGAQGATAGPQGVPPLSGLCVEPNVEKEVMYLLNQAVENDGCFVACSLKAVAVGAADGARRVLARPRRARARRTPSPQWTRATTPQRHAVGCHWLCHWLPRSKTLVSKGSQNYESSYDYYY